MRFVALLAGAAAIMVAACESAPIQDGDYLVYKKSLVSAGSAGGGPAPTPRMIRLDFEQSSDGWLVTVDDGDETQQVQVNEKLEGPDGLLDVPSHLAPVWLPSSMRKAHKKVLGGQVMATKKPWMGHQCVVIKAEQQWLKYYDRETGVLFTEAIGLITGFDPRPPGGTLTTLEESRIGGVEWKRP